MDADDEARQIDEVTERLTTQYANRPADEVKSTVDDAYRHFDGTAVRDFVPLLVERRANLHLGGSSTMVDSEQVPPHTEG
ncbi:three-helix bundle dimerization domain-containing protein [Gordonia soli]|uniref:Uncharacterized protein n=1 Tax=Gordonia soli NBRC 108243 TaxID=1223545 RepID=M0QJ75_9ACTN|nr:hypothetical protein [Gordonia soli]GAC68680.1 hypothetical protein GS4_17_00660 [Gordonia soli NBRC 108243]